MILNSWKQKEIYSTAIYLTYIYIGRQIGTKNKTFSRIIQTMETKLWPRQEISTTKMHK